MKAMLIGLSILGFTNLSSAQNLKHNVSYVHMDEIVVSPMKNVSYYNSVYNPYASKEVIMLESDASNYDVSNSKIFNNTIETYKVWFENTEGSILAVYDTDGELINSVEKFEHARLPESVRLTLKNSYPDWTLNSTVYRVNYFKGKDVKKVYNIQLKRDREKVNLKIDCQGVILRSSD